MDFVLSCIFLEESLEDAEAFPKFRRKVRALFTWIWQITSFAKRARHVEPPLYHSVRHDDQEHDSELDSASEAPDDEGDQHELSHSEIWNRDIILLLVSYLIFALCNISFNSLFPVFSQAQPPLGRALSPSEIGLSQGFTGLVTMIFQIFVFGKLRDKMGNRWSYRAGLFGFVLSFLLLPFVGYKGDDSKGHLSQKSILMAIELCFVLLIKTVAAVGGLTSSLLLVRSPPLTIFTIQYANEQVTNSAPNHAVLGALNGLAQTLSAAGRAVGPFLSGGLFSLGARMKPQGVYMTFGVFAAVSFVGFMLSFGIRGRSLEADGVQSEDENYKSDDEEGSPGR